MRYFLPLPIGAALPAAAKLSGDRIRFTNSNCVVGSITSSKEASEKIHRQWSAASDYHLKHGFIETDVTRTEYITSSG